jgi:hypothetical protein
MGTGILLSSRLFTLLPPVSFFPPSKQATYTYEKRTTSPSRHLNQLQETREIWKLYIVFVFVSWLAVLTPIVDSDYFLPGAWWSVWFLASDTILW